MGDPWNLSLDQSCFEDWNEEKIIIRGEDLTDVYKRINTLSDLTESDSDFVKLLDRQLSISFFIYYLYITELINVFAVSLTF